MIMRTNNMHYEAGELKQNFSCMEKLHSSLHSGAKICATMFTETNLLNKDWPTGMQQTPVATAANRDTLDDVSCDSSFFD